MRSARRGPFATSNDRNILMTNEHSDAIRPILSTLAIALLAVGTGGATCGPGGDDPPPVVPSEDAGSTTASPNDSDTGPRTQMDGTSNDADDSGSLEDTGGAEDTTVQRDTVRTKSDDTGTSTRDTGGPSRDSGTITRDTGTSNNDTSSNDAGQTTRCNSDGNEPNDSASDAKEIKSLLVHGAVCDHDPDWFELNYHDYKKDEVIQAALSSSHQNPKLDFELYRRKYNGSITKVETSSLETTAWGWSWFDIMYRVPMQHLDSYLLRIATSHSTDHVPYSFDEVTDKSYCQNDRYEPNDSKNSATHLAYNQKVGSRDRVTSDQASLCGQDTVDWYSVQARAGDKVYVQLHHPGADDVRVTLKHPNDSSSHQLRRLPLDGDRGSYTVPRGSGNKLYIRIKREAPVEDASAYTMWVTN